MEVRYIAMSEAEHDRLIRLASKPEEYLTPELVMERYNLSKDFLRSLVTDKKLKKYTIPDHPKVTRYKLSEIENLFKSL